MTEREFELSNKNENIIRKTQDTLELDVDSVLVLNDVYPRDGFDNNTVNSYALNVDALPPIIVTKENILVDGYHRLLAHRLCGKKLIKAEIVDIPKERILWEATKLNAKHGKQLRVDEKRHLARKFYSNNHCTYAEISEVLAVKESTLSNWLSDLVQEEKEEQKRQIMDLYLQCCTYDEIESKLEVSSKTIAKTLSDFKNELGKQPFVPESLQLFNVWNFPNRDKRYGLDFKGTIPGQIIENVLHYYTEPLDVVVDPMAGGGTTIDVCKAMYRRYRAYDINKLRDDIQKHDIRNGYPKECKNTDLIFLDPPYFDMTFKDLFNDVHDFYGFIEKVAHDSFETIKANGVVAFLMQDMTELGNYCLSGESYCIFRKEGFTTIAHISCPLSTQQFLPQQVEKAKQDKHLLGRNRDLYIFKKEVHNG